MATHVTLKAAPGKKVLWTWRKGADLRPVLSLTKAPGFHLDGQGITLDGQGKTPTLVLHGDKDERVPLAQGRAWHKGLKVLGVPTEMVVYRGEGHLIEGRANQIDVMRRVLAWYDKHLTGRGNLK